MGGVRQYESGATRSSNGGKFEYSRFLAPEVIQRFAAYMHKHRVQADGALRDPDNWKKGIPRDDYMASLFRHMVDLWLLHETGEATRPEDNSKVDLEDTLCSILFNTQGYLYEELKRPDCSGS